MAAREGGLHVATFSPSRLARVRIQRMGRYIAVTAPSFSTLLKIRYLLPALMFSLSMDRLLVDDVRPRLAPVDCTKLPRSRAALQLEILGLRHQLQVLNRSRPHRLRLAQADRRAAEVVHEQNTNFRWVKCLTYVGREGCSLRPGPRLGCPSSIE